RVIGVHVAVGGIGRRLELGRLRADRIRHLLGVALAWAEGAGDGQGCGSCHECATIDHGILPVARAYWRAVFSVSRSYHCAAVWAAARARKMRSAREGAVDRASV